MKLNHNLHQSIWNTRILVWSLILIIVVSKRYRKRKKKLTDPLFFTVFTRRRIDHNSQWIWKKVKYTIFCSM